MNAALRFVSAHQARPSPRFSSMLPGEVRVRRGSGAQHEPLPVTVEEVDEAGVRSARVREQANDPFEDLLEVERRADRRDDLLEEAFLDCSRHVLRDDRSIVTGRPELESNAARRSSRESARLAVRRRAVGQELCRRRLQHAVRRDGRQAARRDAAHADRRQLADSPVRLAAPRRSPVRRPPRRQLRSDRDP